jgi:hypothetical protein
MVVFLYIFLGTLLRDLTDFHVQKITFNGLSRPKNVTR